MPKITAATVAEHRDRQHAALVQEAERILLADGASGVTPASIGQAVGLARSSVYEYFASTGDLLAEVAHRAIAHWSAELEAALARADAGWPRLEVYICTSLRMVQEGKHDIADRLEGFNFTAAQRQTFMEPHDRLASPLLGIMDEIGVGDPTLTATLTQGLVDAAARHVRSGGDADDTSARVMALLRVGLSAAV